MENNKPLKQLCPAAKKCAGCQLQNLEYTRQLALKQSIAVKLLGGFCRVEGIIGMESPFYYRNKVCAAFGTTARGQIISGIYRASTHDIVKVDSCMLEDAAASAVAVTVRSLLGEFKLSAYDERTGRGFLRHTLVKRAFATGQMMVVLVSATPIFPSKQNFVKALLQRHPGITTVVHNINPHRTSMVLGERESVLYGKGYIEDELCGMRFRISAKSFYQINPVQTKLLYNTALEYARLTKNDTVIDAYCGTGTIGIIAAPAAKSVTGTELNADAVKDARANARLNGTDNITFVCRDAGEFMLDAAAAGAHCNVVFTDPPRAGCSREFLTALIRLAPERVVYISCNPETQARDMTVLCKNGYRVKKIQPYDLFPHTKHVETVCLLVRK